MAQSINKTLSKEEETELSLVHEDDLQELQEHFDKDEWIAIKSLSSLVSSISTTNHNWNVNKKSQDEIINIVSLTVEKEKLIIVSREHNRIVSDDENTKQWFGMFTAEQFYTVHQQMSHIEPKLDRFYPSELRPIKGLLFTYFLKDLSKALKSNEANFDLQDNELCYAIKTYLNKAFEFLGKSLFVDILYNDLKSEQYFEVYSEFNLKRLQSEIQALQNELFTVNNSFITNNVPLTNNSNSIQNTKRAPGSSKKPSMSNSLLMISQNLKEQEDKRLQQQFQFNLKRYLESYVVQQDKAIEAIIRLYGEYYNNLTKPLLDSKNLAERKLKRTELKLNNLKKSVKYLNDESTVNNLNQLKESGVLLKNEIYEYSNHIDFLYIEYKEALVQLYSKLVQKLDDEKQKLIIPKFLLSSSIFDILTKERRKKFDLEINNKRIQMYQLELKMLERKRDALRASENLHANSSTTNTNELLIQIIKLKLKLYGEEESVLKRKLNDLKCDKIDQSTRRDVAEFETTVLVDELKPYFSNQFDMLLNRNLIEEKIQNEYVENESIDSDDEANFHDAIEDPEVLLEINACDNDANRNSPEVISLKKQILNISSKKSSLRLNLNKLLDLEAQAKKEKEQLESLSTTQTILAASTNQINKSSNLNKKQEDQMQRELCSENRKKALERIREYKLKTSNALSSTESLVSSIASTSSSLVQSATSLNKNTKQSRPYIPKSKQRILPPNTGKAKSSTKIKSKISEKMENSTITEEPFASENQLDEEENKEVTRNTEVNTINQVVASAPQLPPIPPCPIDLFTNSLTNAVSIPPPPPPPPLVGSLFTNSSLVPSASTLPPPPPPPPIPVDYLNSSQSIPKSIKSSIEVSNKTVVRNENKNKSREFDINEIKNFRFNTNKPRREISKRENKPTNTWENLMDEIRMNPSEKLRKVTETDKQSRIDKNKALQHSNDMDSDSRLLRDLNQILNQRSKFFNEDDDDDENGSSSSEAWDSSNEN